MDLTTKLINVRRATRLLAAYNRRLLGLLSMVDGTLSNTSKLRLKHNRWEPVYHRKIGRQTTAPFGRWGWDYLPLSWMWMRWTTDGKDTPVRKQSTVVSVQHVADTGYSAAHEKADGEPTPEDFVPVDQTKTELWIWVIAVLGRSEDRWNTIEEHTEEMLEWEQQLNHQIHTVSVDALESTPAGTELRYVGWKVDVSALETEDDVDTHVLAPIRQALTDIYK